MDTERESIWSMPAQAKGAYYALFVLQFLAGVVVILWADAGSAQPWADRLVGRWNDVATLAVASAATTLVVLELWGYIMVLADWILRKREARGVAQGIAEGMAKGRAEGIAEGKAEGIAEGVVKGTDEALDKLREAAKRLDKVEVLDRIIEETRNGSASNGANG